ncbi:hypothetical protein P886_0293 [Alteromonadaceae bacterium 2753L.S.0a.02]|nr:hypothetical protein P886_0293 [Alteromonadaceae bacterium 2753L.S.0a.02]
MHLSSLIDRRWLTLLAIWYGASALALNYNVSERVTGNYESVNFVLASKTPTLACGDCRYSLMSGAAISSDATLHISPSSWPAPFHNSLVSPYQVVREDATPQGQLNNYGYQQFYDWDYFERSATAYNPQEHYIVSEEFSSGEAQGVTQVHIEASNNATNSRQYFAYFVVPERVFAKNFAYNLVPGSNGGTYVYKEQNSGFTRSLVEVVVDGLPVWTQTSGYNYPEDFIGNTFFDLTLLWGESSATSARLFLGTFEPGESFTLDYSIFTDALVDAPNCGTESLGYWGDYATVHHCYGLSEKRNLPISVRGSQTPLIQIYTKEL